MAGIGEAPGIVVGVGVGAAAAAAIQPAVEIPRQEAWAANPNRILDPELLARLVAQGAVDLSDAHTEALRDGYSSDKVDALVYLAQTVPGVSEALSLWRRGLLSDNLFSHVLVKAGLDQRYTAPILSSKTAEAVGLGDVAMGVVRGILPAPAWVPVAPPATGDKVPRFPQVDIDPVTLAHYTGFDEEMLKLMVGRSGLSMAPVMAAQAFFRGIIGPNDFLLAIAEGDLRTEWADPLREVSRQILTADQAMEGVLRGWWPKQTGYDLAADHGMTQANAERLYQIRRRPMTVANITKALARGGNFDASNAPFADPYDSSVHEADLGPEWYDLAKALKYSLPSAFVIRSLLTDGALTEQEGENLFLQSGWRPDLAQKVAQHYAGGTSSSTDKHVTSAQGQLWTTTHTAYKNGEVDWPEVQKNLTTLGISTADQASIQTLWNAERDTYRKQLTPTQIKKAWKGAVLNPATGQAWTKDDALAALIARGYSPNDANTFLEL